MPSFGGLGTALTGLQAQQRQMQVISQNITNVDTDGYSRRRVELTSTGNPPGTAIFSKANDEGQGVSVESVTRVRDEFLDTTARSALSNEAASEQTAQLLGQIETIVPEPSDTGLSSQLGKLWSNWSDAANSPSSVATRTALLNQASTVATTLNTAAAGMKNLRTTLTTQLGTSVAKVNNESSQIAKLNSEIRTAISAGVDPSDLQDRRDNLIDDLSTSVGATTHANADGTVDVFLGGGTLVRSDTATALNLTQAGPLDPPNDTLPVQKVGIVWSNGGDDVQRLSGKIGAMLIGANETLPRYMTQLNDVAGNLVTTVNALHQTGQGLDPLNDVNLDFFDAAKTTADTIALSSDVAGKPSRVALAIAGGGTLDSSVGQSIAALASSTTGPDATFQSMVGGLGIETQSATDNATVQSQISSVAHDARTSVSGVNLDEEMTNLLAAQRAYQSAARLMTTIDSMLDTLINRTGMTT